MRTQPILFTIGIAVVAAGLTGASGCTLVDQINEALCETDSECPGERVCVEATCRESCSEDDPCSDGLVCADRPTTNGGFCQAGVEPSNAQANNNNSLNSSTTVDSYEFVAIQPTGSRDDTIELDAVEVIRPDGTSVFANVVEYYERGFDDGTVEVFDEVLGEPDDQCTLDGVATVGFGGVIVVDFDGPTIGPRDSVRIHEVSGHVCPEFSQREAYAVYVTNDALLQSSVELEESEPDIFLFPGAQNAVPNNMTANNTTANNTTVNSGDFRSYPSVSIVDRTTSTNSGSLIDAIVLEKPDGTRYPAVAVEASVFPADPTFGDDQAVLGQPDSDCAMQNVFELEADGGYVEVSFGANDPDTRIESGDTIIVYELGPTVCPTQPSWTDNPYEVYGVSGSDWVIIGDGGEGTNSVVVP